MHMYACVQTQRGQELCESRGGRPGLLGPNSPYGLCAREATLNEYGHRNMLIHIHTYIYFPPLPTHTRAFTCMHAHTHARTHAHTLTHTHTLNRNANTRQMHTNSRIHAHTDTYAHTHTHTHTLNRNTNTKQMYTNSRCMHTHTLLSFI